MRHIIFIMILFPFSLFSQQVKTISQVSGITDALVFDLEGNLVGSDYYGGKVFKVELPDGLASAYSEGYTTCNGLAFDDESTLYMADNLGNKIYKILPDGTSEIFVSMVNPSSLIFELDSDTLIAASYAQDRIVKISPDGNIINWSVGGQLSGGPNGFVFDENGHLYVCNFDDRKITKILEDGSQVPLAQGPEFGAVGGIAYANGYIYGTLLTTHKIFRTDLEGNVEIFLGSTAGDTDGDAAEAKFNSPNGILASWTGDTLYVSDLNTSNIRMVTDLEPALNHARENIEIGNISLSPNPMNGNGYLEFSISHPQKISIELANMEGHPICQPVKNKFLSTGKHRIQIQCESLPNGLYSLALKTQNQDIELTKVVIAK